MTKRATVDAVLATITGNPHRAVVHWRARHGWRSRLFASRTGWPSFFRPASEEAVGLRTDKGWLLRRTEVVCRRCGGHLGHVFRDGPRPTRRRYCINSCALSFEPTPPDRDPGNAPPGG